MKETEEEIYKRCLAKVAKEVYGVNDPGNLWDDERSSIGLMVAKEYHQERLKSSLPSEQEIDEKVKEMFSLPKEYYLYNQPEFYKEGFKDALALLTKGDK